VSPEETVTVVAGAEHAPPREVKRPAGSAWIFSSRAPDKDGPNEDAAAVLPYGDGASVLMVADGVGGERAGDRASRKAVAALSAALAGGMDEGVALRAAILDGIEKANHAVSDLGGGATTVAVLQVEGEVVRPYHVGDSGILIVGQRGRVRHRIIAHGPVGYAVEAGLLDAGEALHHEERNVVSNVVGSEDMRIEIGPSVALAARDTALLATDGLFDNLYEEEIVALIRKGSLRGAAEALAELALGRMLRPRAGKPSKPDDMTFILYRRASPKPSRRGGRAREGGA
jgi:serine/threonine protein phosphatase PrpC